VLDLSSVGLGLLLGLAQLIGVGVLLECDLTLVSISAVIDHHHARCRGAS
jgi:hypothetical protein